MGKKNRGKPSFNSKQPSFLQNKEVKKPEDSTNKREDKIAVKEKNKESKQLGLPNGIDMDDIKKFNELLKKHGDQKQNSGFFKKTEEIEKRGDKKFLKCVGGISVPYVDFNNPEDFNPDADALEVARKAWNWLL